MFYVKTKKPKFVIFIKNNNLIFTIYEVIYSHHDKIYLLLNI